MPSQKTANESGTLSLPHQVALPNMSVSTSKWNTSHLGMRVGADAVAAASASVLVAPIICVIDRSIVAKTAWGNSLSHHLRNAIVPAFKRPHAFIASRPFLLIFSLYFSTYFTANSADTLSNTVKNKSSSTVSSNTTKFLATSAVNMSLCTYKDGQFARMFGKPQAALPVASLALFAARDSLTIFASFNLPSIIAPRLAELPPVARERLSRILSTESQRMNTAQFIAPAAMQIFSTPIHLLGLDMYNRQSSLGVMERASNVARGWAVATCARMGRIIPAFGVGGVVNSRMRRDLMQKIEA